MKKKYLAIIPVLAFAIAITVVPAFASSSRRGGNESRSYNQRDPHMQTPKVEMEVKSDNDANVTNNVDAKSNSGNNNANRNGDTGTVITGRADSLATSDTEANSNLTNINARRTTNLDVDSDNDATVRNDVDAYSNSGKNDANSNGDNKSVPRMSFRTLMGSHDHHHNNNDGNDGRGYVETGEAISTAGSTTLLNSNVTRIR